MAVPDAGTGADAPVDASGPETDGPPASPPKFGGVTSAGPASATSLQVTWNPATDAVTPASEIVYDVYVATSAGGEDFAKPTVTSPPGAVSVLVAGLTTSSTYYVVVRARNLANVDDSNVVETSGVPTADTNPPSFGGASDANPAAQGGITITWAAAIDDLSPTQGIGYFIYMSTTAGAEDFGTPSYVTEPGATSYVVPALPRPGATYYFVVRSHDAAGNTDSNVVEVSSTPGADTIAPVFAGCTSAVTLNSTQVTVTWDPATDNTTPPSQIAYDVYAASTSGQESYTTATGTFTGVSVGLVTGLKQNTTYYFVCRARDLSGNEAANTSERIATTPVDTTPPTFAGITSVTNVTATGATLGWAAATDPQTPASELVYDVFQSTSAGGENFTGPPSATSTAGATSITLGNLPPSSVVYWVVRARDLAGNEDTNTIELNATTGVSFAENVQPI
ncbi:MAG: fibronectin type III domain-containing protein, partial [Polyangiaceae bacterium]